MTPRGLVIRFLIFLILLLASVGFNIYFLLQSRPGFLGINQPASSGASQFNPNVYQAVFLDNNQVYFGRVSSENDRYLVLTDIYYLQNYSLQDQSKNALLNPSDLVLIKLGREMHQPKDQMTISRQHILFIEELADDSRVVQTIKTYKQE